VFVLESDRLLEVNVNARVWCKLRACRLPGQLCSHRDGIAEGGSAMRALKKFRRARDDALTKIACCASPSSPIKQSTSLVLRCRRAINVNGERPAGVRGLRSVFNPLHPAHLRA
jgi:hypothetical protein